MAEVQAPANKPEKPRRGRDEGSVYQRSDGRWVSVISLGWNENGRKRKTIYGKTESEVRKKMLLEQQRIASGLPVTNDQMTVATLVDDWLEMVKTSVRPKTYRIYEQIACGHIKPALGKEKVTRVDARKIQMHLVEKQKTGLSPRTVSHIRAILRQVFEQAMKWDIVGRNVVKQTKPPAQPRYNFPILSPEQVDALFGAFMDHRYGVAYTVMGGLGLRLGEALGVRWSDITFDENGGGSLTVRVQLQHINGGYHLMEPKSDAGRRTIPLPKFVAEALKKRKADQEDEEWLAGEDWNNEFGLVFTNQKGGPLDDARVRQRFKEMLDKNGLPDMRLHDLRHICATLLIAQKIEARMVMEVLGHSQISLTLNTYTHILKGATQAAADAMDRAVTPRRKTDG